MGILPFSALGGLGKLAIPGASQFLFVVVFVSTIFLCGWWLRYDARADATRAVVERVATGIRKDNEKLVSKVRMRNKDLERAVVVARKDALESEGREGQLLVAIEQAKEQLKQKEIKIAELIKKYSDGANLQCGLTSEMLKGVNK